MKKFNLIQEKLLEKLSDGACHSGNSLGNYTNVSRTAVWKQIKLLINLGAPIISHPNIGYQLKYPVEFLNEFKIRGHLDSNLFAPPVNLHMFASIDSTNRYLKTLPSSDLIEICCAETQTTGRGRFNRIWHSPFAENIYCSVRRQFNCDLSELSGLSLVVSLAVLETLHDCGIKEKISVKWPNDLLWLHKKLCGILIEVIAESHGSANVIIGIGLNVNSITTENSPIENPWCSLHEITGARMDRNFLIAHLLIHLENHLNQFLNEGFAVFMDRWLEVDDLNGKHVVVSQATGKISGTAHGVTETGQLILTDAGGTPHQISSGDATLLKNPKKQHHNC